MKKLLSFTAIALLTTSGSSFAGWSTVGSAGATLDGRSQDIYRTTSAGLSLLDGKTGLVSARYNVTFPSEITPSPNWTTFEISYTDYTANTSVQAILYEVDPCTGFGTEVARVNSTDSSTAGFPNPDVNPPRECATVSLPSGFVFDFENHNYYIAVLVARAGDTAPRVAFRGARLY